MNIPDTAKFYKTLDICIDLNTTVGDSASYNICEYTKEAFCAATTLIDIAMRKQDIQMFAEVFDKTRRLTAMQDKLSPEKRREVIKQKDVFDRLVMKKLSGHPSFVIKVMIPNIARVK